MGSFSNWCASVPVKAKSASRAIAMGRRMATKVGGFPGSTVRWRPKVRHAGFRAMRAACMQKPRRMPGLRGGPARDRTLDPMIKSHLLYQLSYRTIFQVGCDQPGRKCRSEISKLCMVFRGSVSRPWPPTSAMAVAGAACSSAFPPACAKCLSPGGGERQRPRLSPGPLVIPLGFEPRTLTLKV